MTPQRKKLSIVVPAHNEELNLPVMYERLCHTMSELDLDWEWIVIDDHSRDNTFGVMARLARDDRRIHAMRLSRNCGSHTAIACGLHHAKGDAVVVLAADLQDPPELVPTLVSRWLEGAQVVWASRGRREGEKASTILFARVYYAIMRKLVGIRDMPANGADFLLADRTVVDAFCQFSESNLSIMALITWMGFRQVTVTYDKQARLHGQSGWSLSKKVKLLVDSIISFTYLPIRAMSVLGALVAVVGFGYAAVVIHLALTGQPAQGWASLMVVTLVLGGIQMLMMGVLGEYLWRALDESRKRPSYLIEARASGGTMTLDAAGRSEAASLSLAVDPATEWQRHS